MGLSISSNAFWILSLALDVCLCALIFWRGAYNRLPWFTAYLLCQILGVCVSWLVMRRLGFWSSAYYYTSWVANEASMITMWLVTAELCYRGFRAYRGIWALTWRLLLGLSVFLILHAAYDASKETHRIGALKLILQRDLALASAVILLAILIIDRMYASQLDGLERQIAAGFSVYMIAILLSNSFLILWLAAHWPSAKGHPPSIDYLEALWNGARFIVLNTVLAAWCFALRKPLPVTKPVPEMLPPDTYAELSPAINYRLRALNARLMDFLKT